MIIYQVATGANPIVTVFGRHLYFPGTHWINQTTVVVVTIKS